MRTCRPLLLAIGLFVAYAHTCHGQATLVQRGEWPPFPRVGVAALSVHNGYLYAGLEGFLENRGGLAIFDLQNPARPWEVGGLDTRDAGQSVFVSGNYAYVANGHAGLQIIDVSNPSNPQRVSGYDTPAFAWDVVVSGRYAYVIDRDHPLDPFDGRGTSVLVIDVSDPVHPELAGRYESPGPPRGLAVSGNYVYVADEGFGLHVIDVSNPANPQRVGGALQIAMGVTVSGNYAYVSSASQGLYVIDVSDPANPQPVGRYDSDGSALKVTLSGKYAYLADGSAGLQVIDVSNPASPQRVGGYSTTLYATDVAVFGRYAYVTDRDSPFDGYDRTANIIRVLDVSSPAIPRGVGGYNTVSGYVSDVAASGNYAYVADREAGLQVISLSNLANPQREGNYDTGGSAMGVAVAGDYAYVADGGGGLQVIAVNDPANPRRVGGAETIGSALRVAVAGNYAYVACGDTGLQVIDVSSPTNPRRVGGHVTPGSATAVAVSGKYAYVAAGVGGLQIVDVSNPANPQGLGGGISRFAAGVAVSGKYAYVASASWGVDIIDVSYPRNPQRVSVYTNDYANDVAVSGRYAYIAHYNAGVEVIDISDPLHPQHAGGSANGFYAERVFVTENQVFVCRFWDGFVIFDPLRLGPLPNASVVEGNSGTTNAVFTIVLSSNYAQRVSVDYTTVDGSATGGLDYRPTSGTLVFNPGETSQSINVEVYGDTLEENNEYFYIVLSNPTNMSLVQTQAVCSIVDDDFLQIIEQPASQSVRGGDNAAFSADAISSLLPVFYQWRSNRVNVAGANGTNLTLMSVGSGADADYSVVVSNQVGVVTSMVAHLTVLISPVITMPPLSQSVVAGGSVTFSVGFTGNPTPFGVEWRQGSLVRVSNTVNRLFDFYALSNAHPTNSGTWRVVVKNQAGGPLENRTFTVTVLADNDRDGLPDGWEVDHGLDTNDVADAALDLDGDTMTNWQEYIAGTIPTNALSYLKVDRISATDAVVIEFQAMSNKTYTVQYTDAFASGSWSNLADVIARTTNRAEVVLDNTPVAVHRFYRLATPRQP